MNRLLLESWELLVRFDFVLRFRSFKTLHDRVRASAVHHAVPLESPEAVCRAVDLACVLYFKQVLCLQRSAATTVLLRRHGLAAHLVIGAQLLPYLSHAWVEIDGLVVNDKPYVKDRYAVLDRC